MAYVPALTAASGRLPARSGDGPCPDCEPPTRAPWPCEFVAGVHVRAGIQQYLSVARFPKAAACISGVAPR